MKEEEIYKLKEKEISSEIKESSLTDEIKLMELDVIAVKESLFEKENKIVENTARHKVKNNLKNRKR